MLGYKCIWTLSCTSFWWQIYCRKLTLMAQHSLGLGFLSSLSRSPSLVLNLRLLIQSFKILWSYATWDQWDIHHHALYVDVHSSFLGHPPFGQDVVVPVGPAQVPVGLGFLHAVGHNWAIIMAFSRPDSALNRAILWPQSYRTIVL